jgi:hypothetical protein
MNSGNSTHHSRIFTILPFLILAFATIATAGDLPRFSSGNEVVHGGSPIFAKAGGDTINLMASHNDPTNEAGEPAYYGDFEDADGNPSWNGWTKYDITQPTESHWNVSDYNQPVAGNLAAWCGDIAIVSCGGDDPDGGYGNSWHDLIEFRQSVPNTGISSTVTVTATLIHDSEPGYDYTYLSYKYQGQPFGDMQSWDGAGTVSVSNSVTYLPPEYLDSTDVAVYFRFKSDGGWSDEDCSFPSAGGCQVDDINVNIVNGAFSGDYFEDFSGGTFGIWSIAFPDGVGNFAHIWVGLEDNDPCNTNYSPQVAFIDDDVVVPGTGGSDCINWCYGPGGYIVTTTGGLAGPSEHLHNAIESPVMTWPGPKNGVGPDPDGILFALTAYSHEDLSSDAPGIFYTWGVRSADTDGSAGDVQAITDQGWQDRNFVYYGGPYYVRWNNDVTDLMNPGRDELQVQLAVYELGWVWNWTGNDGYPAPYFDDVTVKIFPYIGPGMAARQLDLAQDNFPARGTIDLGDLASHSVRFDMANNVSLAAHLRNDPGDSCVIDVVPVRAGADHDGNPEFHYILDPNPVFDPYRTSGLSHQGTVVCWPAVGISSVPSPGKWAFDLPDTGFLFPGDVLRYYITATDAIGGVGGTDPQTSLMPADTTGFSSSFDNPLNYNSLFTVRALPSIRDDGFGGYEQPQVLFLKDTFNGGYNELHWYGALKNIGLEVGEGYDVYSTNGASSGVGNGIGGRANALMLSEYDDILYTSATHKVSTISNGDYNGDAGNDVGTLKDWLDQGSKDIFLTGDNLATDLGQSGTETLDLLENYMGVTVVADNVRPLIGTQTAPLVRVVPGNPVWEGVLDSWIAYGGCFSINTFDGVNVYGSGQRIAEFTDPSGQTGQYTFSAATLNIRNPGPGESRIISMPVDFMFIYTDSEAPGNLLPGRALLLRDVLGYFGVEGDAIAVSDAPDRLPFTVTNFPNPFNPATTIKYSMPKAGHLKLSIYNVRGQLVKTLIDGVRPAGPDQAVVWEGTDNLGAAAASGLYFYEARTGGEVEVGKMSLVK